MKKRSEVGVAQFCEANCQSSKTPGLAGRVRGLEGAGPVPLGRARASTARAVCLDCKAPGGSTPASEARCFAAIGDHRSLFMNNPG